MHLLNGELMQLPTPDNADYLDGINLAKAQLKLRLEHKSTSDKEKVLIETTTTPSTNSSTVIKKTKTKAIETGMIISIMDMKKNFYVYFSSIYIHQDKRICYHCFMEVSYKLWL